MVLIMINNVKQYIMIFLAKFINILLCIYWIFPIRNRQICFYAHKNKYNCNPKYIYEYIKNNYNENLSFIWMGNAIDNTDCYDTKFARYISLKQIYYYLTSRIIISNVNFPAWIPFRKEQILINTWHGGGAYKKVGLIKNNFKNKYILFCLKKMGKRTDFFVSSCKMFTDVMSESCFADYNKFLPYGMPRNDILFFCNTGKNEIKNKIGIDNTLSIILYAPTFRDNLTRSCNDNLDFDSVITAAEKKFNRKFIFLVRWHSFTGTKNIDSVNICKDVSSYPDMQELLYSADMLITDYSSSVWDFSFAFKPGFLFTPDIHNYMDERNFYTPVDNWPYPYALTNEQLCENILQYNEEESMKKIRRHHEELGSYENGDARKKMSALIIGIINAGHN